MSADDQVAGPSAVMVTAIRRRHFQVHFLQWKLLYILIEFHLNMFLGVQLDQAWIGSDNGLVPNRRRGIIWTNDGLIC